MFTLFSSCALRYIISSVETEKGSKLFMSKQSYESGKRWGFAVFNSNVELFGRDGMRKSDAVYSTCRKYELDKSIKKTKSGKILDDKTRSAYKGIADGIAEAAIYLENYGRLKQKRK